MSVFDIWDNLADAVQNKERFPSAAGARVLAKASSYLYVRESPPGSNLGTEINGWATRWGCPLGSAWCGLFADAMYSEARVSDNGIGNPQVFQSYLIAQQKKRLSITPYPGCFVLFVTLRSDGETLDTSGANSGGHHVELFVRWHNKRAGLAVTIGGNTTGGGSNDGEGVYSHITNVRRPRSTDPTVTCRFAVPKALLG